MNISEFPKSEAIYQSLQCFSERMNHPVAPTDGRLTVRLIGEFSAGKTRLLRELLGNQIPPDLFPVSSLERQTRLQLEITYDKIAALTIVKREKDSIKNPPVLDTLTKFPKREELVRYDPLHDRLRLTIPETRLILQSGDGFSEDTSPRRLFLIDMPGWNSGDDELAESQATHTLAGDWNLSLVFVVNASRLDGVKNSERLRDFLEAFSDADFVGIPNLVFVITHCPLHEKIQLENLARDRTLALWSDLGHESDEIGLHIIGVDFNELEDDDLQAFRKLFWDYLLLPLDNNESALHPWISSMHRWPEEWDIRTKILQTQKIITNALNLLERSCKDGNYIAGLNMYKLMGLDKMEMHKKVHDAWLRQLGFRDSHQLDLSIDTLLLDDKHPLVGWWNDYWLNNIEKIITPIREFFAEADKVINTLPPTTEDLQKHLSFHLDTAYTKALINSESSFILLVETAQLLEKEMLPEKVIATLLTLSLLQGRFVDYYDLLAGKNS